MRKLPVFFLIDVSESMAGPALDAVSSGLSEIAAALRQDPQALETVHLSIIAFAGKAKVLTPMIELFRFYPPELPLGGGTALGDALEALMAEIDTQVVRGDASRKGDWKPIVFLMTDGRPTDAPGAAIARWKRDYSRRAHMVAVSVGGGADHATLRQIAEDVVVLGDASPDGFRRFLQWMSHSIAAESRAVGEQSPAGISLAKALPDGARALDECGMDGPTPGGGGVDERVAVFVARCQQSEAPYLARYEAIGGRNEGSRRYSLRQTVALKEGYFDLCGPDGSNGGSIAIGKLNALPACPHCGSGHGLVACRCGSLHCIEGPGPAICPWCGVGSNFQPADEGVSIDFGRSAG
jgi:uncharacterized protein YegL